VVKSVAEGALGCLNIDVTEKREYLEVATTYVMSM